MELARREVEPAHLLVKIESFSLHYKYEVDEFETKEFAAGNYKWRLVIYPNGQGTEKAGEYVSVYLAISNTDSLPNNWEVNAVFSIFIFDQISQNYVYAPGKTRRFFELKTKWGFPNFISKKDFTTPSNGYLIDDSCMFGAEVYVNDNKVVTQCLSLNHQIVPCKHTIKILDFSTLKDVWYSDEFTAEDYKWKIALYVKDNSVKTKSPLRVYLKYVASGTCDPRVMARYTICLKNQLLGSGKNCKITDSDWFDASNLSSLGWTLLSISELNDANSGFIVNDTCLLEVEVFVQVVAE